MSDSTRERGPGGSPPGAQPAAGRETDIAERLAVTWAGARDALWDWVLGTDTMRLSPRWRSLLGHEEREVVGAPGELFKRVHPRDLDDLKRAIDGLIAGRSLRVEHEFRILHQDGGWRWMFCRAVSWGEQLDEPRLIGGSLTDITRERGDEERQLHEAFHDSLTGLPNRVLFLDRLEQCLRSRDRRRSQPVAVLYLDLDRFHRVNDSLGVRAGDALLSKVTERLQRHVRAGDTLARLGGDKFALLLDGVTGAREAVRITEALARDLNRPLRLAEHEVFPSASVGIALATEPKLRADELLRDAVTAMHRAKEDGATTFRLHDPEMHELAKERLRMEADLRHALERGEFMLHYQPIISFASGRLSSFEALIRWKHPERGMVRPDLFIPLAEETGLIVPIGEWVLEEACRQMKEWRIAHAHGDDVAVAVNLSARQFEDPGLVQNVEDCLERSSLPSRALKLEMTESVVMERSQENAATLQSLRDLGIRLLIDDFGTGYSSLASLHTFPLDTLKIDRSFVSRMEFEDEKAEIVRTILTLARKLGMDVVAEGIETVEQLEMLRALECEHGQGFYFSSAVDGEAAREWLESWPVW